MGLGSDSPSNPATVMVVGGEELSISSSPHSPVDDTHTINTISQVNVVSMCDMDACNDNFTNFHLNSCK